MRKPLFPGIKDVEEIADMVDDFRGHVLGNIILHEFLHFLRQFADPLVTPFIVPLDDLDAGALFRMFHDPLGHGFVIRAGGDEFFKVGAFQAGKSKNMSSSPQSKW